MTSAYTDQTAVHPETSLLDARLDALDAMQDSNGKFTRSALAADVAAAVNRATMSKLGLALANPGLVRPLPLPTVMGTPPTDVLGTGATTITGGVQVFSTSPVFRYGGSTMALGGTGASAVKYGTGGAAQRVGYTVEWMSDAQVIEIAAGNVDKYRLSIDGAYVSPTPTNWYASGGSVLLRKIDHGAAGKANRHYRLECGDFLAFNGVWVAPTDTVWAATTPTGPVVCSLGDSWAAGANSGWRMDSYAHLLGKMVGWRDVRSYGISGSGYLKPTKYRDHVQADAIDQQADIVIMDGGTNDYASYTAAAIGAEARVLFSALRTGLPRAVIISILPFFFSGFPNQDMLDTRDAIKSAVTGLADIVIDPIADKWITGSGSTAAPNGTGNADVYITSAHPNLAGHAYLASRLAAAIATSGLA